MRRRQTVVAVLNQMQVLNQQVAPPRPVAQQGPNLFQRIDVYLPAFWMNQRTPSTRPRVTVSPYFLSYLGHLFTLPNSNSLNAHPLEICTFFTYELKK